MLDFRAICGDVSPLQPVQSTASFLPVGTALGWKPRRSRAAPEGTARCTVTSVMSEVNDYGDQPYASDYEPP
jgi:hypothetical protein